MNLSEYAQTWVGKNFAGHATEQCMLFVRHCLTEINAPIKNKVTNLAVDGLETGYALASSLAGPDCGQILYDCDLVKENDILFSKNTYGAWDEGVITHVQIAVSRGRFVHRPTAMRPVEYGYLDQGYWRDHFKCALRWMNVKPEPKGRVIKWFKHGEKSSLLLEGKEDSSSFVLSNMLDPQLLLNHKGRRLLAAEVKLVFEEL